MRIDRLVILAIMIGCKAAAPTTKSSNVYSENLSVLRPDLSESVTDADTLKKDTYESYVPLTGHIKAELDSIAKISLADNRQGKFVDGYVIQVHSGSDREEANTIRDEMYVNFSELKPRVSYHQPSFRVKAGKFTDRLEASRVWAEVKKEFPRALLVPERFKVVYE